MENNAAKLSVRFNPKVCELDAGRLAMCEPLMAVREEISEVYVHKDAQKQQRKLPTYQREMRIGQHINVPRRIIPQEILTISPQ